MLLKRNAVSVLIAKSIKSKKMTMIDHSKLVNINPL